jgi:ADP-heptose:LPS heptosyltransferase
LGIQKPRVKFPIPRHSEAIQSIDTFLGRARVSQFALINPGAGWDSKLWPYERYAELAQRLTREFGIPSIVLWAGDRERQWAESIAKKATAILAPTTTLPELAELCRRASLFVGSDTGPMHLAAAVGTRCVALYGPTRPEVCGPYGMGHQAVQVYLQDGPGRHRRGEDNRAMRAITVEMVAQACDHTLKSRAA